MINEIYCLLRNLPGTTAAGPGGEYVPPDYRPAALPPDLLAVRAALFGADPDAVALNYRLRQYLSILHCGDYAEYVTARDPRVTYWPFTDAEPFQFGLVVTPAGGAGDVFVTGRAPQEAGTGVTQYAWTLTTA